MSRRLAFQWFQLWNNWSSQRDNSTLFRSHSFCMCLSTKCRTLWYFGRCCWCHINFQFFSFSFGPLSDPGVVCWRTKSVLRSVRANIRRETFPQCARREEEERVLLFWYCWGVRESGKETAMGRKKIQITRIMDERNRQVSGTEITVHLYIYVCLCLI